MLDLVKNFLFEKFWLPIIDESVYYNPYNTITYALLFGLLVLYVIYPAIKKLDADINEKFIAGFIPLMMFGGATRVLKDVETINSILLETPFVYMILFSLGISMLYISKKIDDKYQIEYYKTLSIVGTLLFLSTIPFFNLKQPLAFISFTGISILWLTLGYLALRYYKKEFFNLTFAFPVSAHYFDATSTLVALSQGANEKHVIGRFFIELFGNWGIFPLKTLVIIPIVAYIIRNFEGEEKFFYIFIITLLGIGIATRNLIQTIAIG